VPIARACLAGRLDQRNADRFGLVEEDAHDETVDGLPRREMSPPVGRDGMDAAILFADILVVPYGLGQEVAFREGEGPILEPIASPDDRCRRGRCGAEPRRRAFTRRPRTDRSCDVLNSDPD
jgi:hypothetical protein